jgi:hypothetical protein
MSRSATEKAVPNATQSSAGVRVGKAPASQALTVGTQKGSRMMAQPVMYLMATMGGASTRPVAPPRIMRYPIHRA